MGKRRNRGSQGNKISRVHIAEEWRSREAYKREIEKSHDSKEGYMKYRRKAIQRFVKKMKMFESLVESVALYGAEI